MSDVTSRRFTDRAGVRWTVRCVEPIAMSEAFDRIREQNARSAGQSDPEPRVPWLAFESDAGDVRRLTPVPGDWVSGTSADLERWCAAAGSVPPPRPGARRA